MENVNDILVLDNYDSFTYNLVQLLRELGYASRFTVIRNDKISVEDAGNFNRILLSPGPGIPVEAGNLLPIIKRWAPEKSILGVCLGHQAIGEAFGAKLINLPEVFHGVARDTVIAQPADVIFNHLPPSFSSCRYHSWAIDANSISDELQITATDPNGIVMAISHKQFKVKGVQFHPESILTPLGKTIIENWLNL